MKTFIITLLYHFNAILRKNT